MPNRLFLALLSVLIIVRLPSLVQPMGADQGLYSYVGERILSGDLAYRDAWDQKPPAIHYIYAAMRATWPSDASVPAADLIASVATALLLLSLGTAVASRGVGQTAALIFLALSNPEFQRLGGVRIDAQCETFIALAVTAALVMLARKGAGAGAALGAGVLFGLAVALKYNAVLYAGVGLLALWLTRGLSTKRVVLIAAGASLPVGGLLLIFWYGGALRDLYDATILYNVQYSGETYPSGLAVAKYLLVFPIARARVDGLWLVGGAGCLVLVVTALGRRERLFAPVWVAVACLVIAANGSRGLPQYFVQAGPALALAAAMGGAVLWTRRTLVNVAAVALVAYGVWRVNNFQKLLDNTSHDARYALGKISREEHLARYGETGEQRYSAAAIDALGLYLGARTTETDRVYIFGFSCGAYVKAERASASRFFWSRPVIAGFNEGVPGYGWAGLLTDLQKQPPQIIALQQVDWLGDVDNSAHYFTAHPVLGPWLRAQYAKADGPAGYDIWMKKAPARD